MSEDHLIADGRRLAKELQRERGGCVRGEWRCSGSLRERILDYAAKCRGDGESDHRIAKRVGIVQSTLSRWMRLAERRESGFRQVAIVPREEVPTAITTESLRLITPRGFIVEGLAPEQLAFLLRVIG